MRETPARQPVPAARIDQAPKMQDLVILAEPLDIRPVFAPQVARMLAVTVE